MPKPFSKKYYLLIW